MSNLQRNTGLQPNLPVAERVVAQLVGEVFSAAPTAERRRMLEHLLRPLGVLSLVGIAHGIFAKLRFRAGWPQMQIRAEDAQSVSTEDVIVLVEHVQQISVETVDGLAQLLASSPVIAGSAAAAVLVAMLLQRGRNRPVDPDD